MKEVKIYTTPTCVYCKMTKKFFEEHGIKYQELNVAADAKAREDMVRISGQLGVPVITIDNEVVIGYDPEELTRFLGIELKEK